MVLSKVKHDYGAYYIQKVCEVEVADATDQIFFFNVVQSNEFLILIVIFFSLRFLLEFSPLNSLFRWFLLFFILNRLLSVAVSKNGWFFCENDLSWWKYFSRTICEWKKADSGKLWKWLNIFLKNLICHEENRIVSANTLQKLTTPLHWNLRPYASIRITYKLWGSR